MSKSGSNFVVCPIQPLKMNEYNAKETVASVRNAFNAGKTRPLQFRRAQLKRLLCMLEENAEEILQALHQDLGRSRHESISFDLEFSANEIKRILYNFDDWVRPTYPSKPFAFITDTLKVINDPYGVVLVIGCWNYPLELLLQPVAGAIAAGNCIVIKPSEVAAATEKLISEVLPKYLDPACYRVYLGGVPETTSLLKEKFDYIFYTGSSKVGQIVHAAANKHLTPVTLEMGGKSPVYIDETADLQKTVERIMWGKCTNAGQTCIAPDYILCTHEVQKHFLFKAQKLLKNWYGEDIKVSPNFSRIINDHHYNRLTAYLTDKSNIALGGNVDSSQRFIEPTILINVSPNHPVMLEEIFGPILPIINVQNMQEAVAFINARNKPLALYVFTNKASVKKYFLENTSSGGVVINDTMLQCGALTLPFGGVGFSGMGKYHAKDSFDTFVHKKSVVEKSFNLLSDKTLMVRYPPYTSTKTKLLKEILQTRRGFCWEWCKYVLLFLLGAVFMAMWSYLTAQ